jgi:hypothetical protein
MANPFDFGHPHQNVESEEVRAGEEDMNEAEVLIAMQKKRAQVNA